MRTNFFRLKTRGQAFRHRRTHRTIARVKVVAGSFLKRPVPTIMRQTTGLTRIIQLFGFPKVLGFQVLRRGSTRRSPL